MQMKATAWMLLGGGLLLGISTHPTYGQGPTEPTHQIRASLLYDQTRANVVDSDQFWMQGGSVQMDVSLWHGLSAVADVGGMHAAAINSSGVGLDLLTAAAGPRYAWRPASVRIRIFGEGLVGDAYGANSLFPTPHRTVSSAHSLALEAGGGIDLPLSRHVQLRPIQADWVRTQLPNATTNVQNSLRLGIGVIYILR